MFALIMGAPLYFLAAALVCKGFGAAEEPPSSALPPMAAPAAATPLAEPPRLLPPPAMEREVMVPLEQPAAPSVSRYDELVLAAAERHRVPVHLVQAVVHAESNFERTAVSHVGAQGLMQLMPATARELEVRDAFDPRQNIEGGTRYLRQLADRYGGDWRKAVAAYNAGPGAVARYGADVPYAETRAYVKKVMALSSRYEAQGVQNSDDTLLWPVSSPQVRTLAAGGLALRGARGERVLSVSDGVVERITATAMGVCVRVQHDPKYSTEVRGLKATSLSEGDAVLTGESLGVAGESELELQVLAFAESRDPLLFRWRRASRP